MSQQSPERPAHDVAVVSSGVVTPVVFLHGEIDAGSATAIRNAFVQAARHGGERVVVDAAGVTFIDAAGVSVLLAAAGMSGCEVWLRSPSDAVRRVAALVGGFGPSGWRGRNAGGDVRLA